MIKPTISQEYVKRLLESVLQVCVHCERVPIFGSRSTECIKLKLCVVSFFKINHAKIEFYLY